MHISSTAWSYNAFLIITPLSSGNIPEQAVVYAGLLNQFISNWGIKQLQACRTKKYGGGARHTLPKHLLQGLKWCFFITRAKFTLIAHWTKTMGVYKWNFSYNGRSACCSGINILRSRMLSDFTVLSWYRARDSSPPEKSNSQAWVKSCTNAIKTFQTTTILRHIQRERGEIIKLIQRYTNLIYIENTNEAPSNDTREKLRGSSDFYYM